MPIAPSFPPSFSSAPKNNHYSTSIVCSYDPINQQSNLSYKQVSRGSKYQRYGRYIGFRPIPIQFDEKNKS